MVLGVCQESGKICYTPIQESCQSCWQKGIASSNRDGQSCGEHAVSDLGRAAVKKAISGGGHPKVQKELQ